ncbi:MAG: hypothetical protein CMH56_10760 [Myxococcales bacterium]|nr:hypothetical protein [Myxococcales bacterium]|tara:strand:+ start:2746 stop:3501 length:756 start_codon:yes stop_codon:yes gene_type:complete
MEPILKVKAKSASIDVAGKKITAAMCTLSIADLKRFCEAPFGFEIEETEIPTIYREGWARKFLPFYRGLNELGLLIPIIVSCSNGWFYRDDNVEIYGKATILDGARKLGEFTRNGNTDTQVPVFALSNLSEDEECEIRAMVSSPDGDGQKSIYKERFGTSTPRLVIGEHTISLEILSEPFVTRTAFGYVPCLLVRKEGVQEKHHLLIGARSIFTPLDEICQNNGRLSGTRLTIRKEGPEKTAKYLVKLISG